mmetsp:Transcript_68024/g.107893  ORF Transcript_68024/g.107893 Transcript_68024/m.107893 type:complete len:115 (+) Transcript_68024:76-420(+)
MSAESLEKPCVSLGGVEMREVAAVEKMESDCDSPQKKVSTHSVISGKSGRTDRVDTDGNPIEKGKKNHRASFTDQETGQAVAEHKEVTAYKNNGQHGQYAADSDPPCAGCCTIS